MDKLLESLRQTLGPILPMALAAAIVVIIALVLYRTLQEGRAEKSHRFESKLWDDPSPPSPGSQSESSSRRAEGSKPKSSSPTGRKAG
jgi:hypothetical protein